MIFLCLAFIGLDYFFLDGAIYSQFAAELSGLWRPLVVVAYLVGVYMSFAFMGMVLNVLREIPLPVINETGDDSEIGSSISEDDDADNTPAPLDIDNQSTVINR